VTAPAPAPFRAVYRAFLGAYGPQHWWPGDGPFAVMVGAVLTQNTAWVNVERALANLARAGCLSAEAIVGLPAPRLAELLRPSGYFNVKAGRLQELCAWLLARGGLAALAALATSRLRRELLAVKGIGPETAADILLFAFERPVFVIDAYTRRVFGRLGLVDPGADYEDLRRVFESALGRRVAVMNEYHALIVRHGKDVCRTRPRCGACCLARRRPAREG